MCVARQIFQHLLGPAEGRFCIDDPFPPGEFIEQHFNAVLLLERAQLSRADKLLLLKRLSELTDELAAKEPAEHFDGQKESLTAGDPFRAIRRDAAARHDTMQMRVML